MKILVTGATGLVATNIIKKLLHEHEIYAATSRPEILPQRLGIDSSSTSIHCITNDDIFSGQYQKGSFDAIIHCAFTRTGNGQEITSSLNFSKKIIQFAKSVEISKIFYMSSRSIYVEPEIGVLNIETSPISCGVALTSAKYAVELMMEVAFYGTQIKYCNLRLASINELKTEDVMTRPINVFVSNAIHGKPIHIVGGMQVMSYIAPQDIASAVECVLSLESPKTVYNVGIASQIFCN